MSSNREEKTITNEKPVSLHPLEFKEAVHALLASPPQNGRKHQKKKDKKESKGKE